MYRYPEGLKMNPYYLKKLNLASKQTHTEVGDTRN
jgi:hypothetical protein